MMEFKKNYFWHVSVIIIGLVIGLVHHIYIYPNFFHADSAAYQVLASAIRDEGVLLPHDFFYGNQLIMLKISPFIALANYIGFSGYKAYAIGGAIAICVWFYICNLIISKYCGNKYFSLLLSTCLFIPLGMDDIDFLLGQESHLSNVVLSIMICLPVIIYIQESKKSFLCISALAVILMTAEQPIRTLIIIAPFILFILIIFRSKTSVVSMLSIAVSFVIGKMANDYLLGRHFPLKVDYSQASLLISPDKAIDNLFIILKSILVYSSSSSLAVGSNAIGILTPFYFMGLLYILLFIATIVYGLKIFLYILIDGRKTKTSICRLDLLCALGATGFVLGLLLISCLNPEGRHIFWATCILKISVFATIFKIFKSNIKNNVYSYSLTIAMAICMSAIAPVLYTTKAESFSYNKSNMNSEINKKIISIVRLTGIKYIYGED
ncbi:hypothetical protein GPE80_004559, partial [Salmonella enterica subsp. enterica serovar Braenderup]|nr:hypothetical protein [Salmonella enterica subsp. enterica serovar Braenderup]